MKYKGTSLSGPSQIQLHDYTRKGDSTYQASFRPDNFWFQLLFLIKYIKTCILELWKDKGSFQGILGLVLIIVEIPVENQDMKDFQEMESFQNLESQHHTQYIIKPSM